MAKRGKQPNYFDVACPNESCPNYGKENLGNIVSNGTYSTKSGRVRKFICRTCGRVFCDRQGTLFYDLRSDEEKVLQALAMLAKGMTLRGTAEILHTKLDTIRRWLRLAADQAEKVSQHLMRDFQVTKVELDELWTFVKKNELRKRAILKRARGG